MKVAYYRGLLASKLARTAHSKMGMMAVGLSREQVHAQLQKFTSEKQLNTGQMTVACINSTKNVTISGPDSHLDALKLRLDDEEIFARKLMIPIGYHSPQMNEIALEYLEHIKDLEPSRPSSKTVMMSSVTCEITSAKDLCTGDYWVQNMVSPVNFLEAMRLCFRSSSSGIAKKLDRSHLNNIFTQAWVEIGPHAALQGPIRDILSSVDGTSEVRYTSALVRNRSALETVLEAAGQLHCQGFSVEIDKLNRISAFQPLVLTDLPQYPFDHSVLFWEESRLSKEFRFRQHANHDLLGSQLSDWNPQEPAWRLVMKADEMLWIEDHKLNGSILYPAAGMLAMAIEAVRQFSYNRPVCGFEIKDAVFPTPLLLSTSPGGHETQFCLRRSTDPTKESSCWYEYRLYLHQIDGWEEICRGSIRADYGRPESEVDGGKEAKSLFEMQRNVLAAAAVSCTKTMTPDQIYRRFRDVGLEYGPTFRLLSDVSFNDTGEATAVILPSHSSVRELKSSHIIHPSTLDSILQLVFAALTGGESDDTPTMVPTRINRLWIANTEIGNPSTEPIHVYAQASRLSHRSAQSTILAVGTSSQELKVQIDGFEVTAVPGPDTASRISNEAKRHCYHMDWKIDLDTLNTREIQQYCERAYKSEVEPVEWFQDLDFMTLAYGSVALEELKRLHTLPVPSVQKYVSWMQWQLDRDAAATPPNELRRRSAQLQDAELLDMVCKRLDGCKRGEFYLKVGRNLTKVLLGEIDPLQLIFEDEELVGDFYQEVNETSQSFDMMARYLEALIHKDPGMKILEIGAGTGATTTILNKTLVSQDNNPRYEKYDFTDISPSFFSKAQEKFQAYGRMNYRVLDIEGDIPKQCYEDGSYDLIIAANVLHATRDLRITLQNVRRLLKPNGKLILMEITHPQKVRMGFVFGLLPGWWLSAEDYRQRGPCISKEKWSEVLQQNGFSGTDLAFRDYKDDTCHGWNLMVSTAVTTTSSPLTLHKAVAIVDKTSPRQLALAEKFSFELEILGGSASSVLDLEEAASMEDRRDHCYIVLIETERQLIRNLTSRGFNALQSLLSSSGGVLWVTRGGGSCPEPDYGLINGLARVSRQENSRVSLVTLALDYGAHSVTGQNAYNIAKVFKNTALGLQNGSFEPEYLEVDGTLQINRVVEAKDLNDHIFSRTSFSRREHEWGKSPPLKLHVRVPGLLDSLEFKEDTSYYKPFAPDEVEVEIETIGVNFKECLTALGRVNTDTLGSECAGVVTRIGAVVGDFRPGDRVALLVMNSYRSFVRQKASQIVRIPDGMSFTEAAAIPTAFITSWYSLCEVARLQKNETVLIHAASGGTGQAAIQIAKYIGAEIFATVGSLVKKKLLTDVYDIPEDHIFYSRDTSFADGIKRVTKKGVDVVLNSLSGEGLVASWECIAPYGRFLEIGRKDIDSHGSLPMFPFIKNASFTGVDLAAIAVERPALVQSILMRIMSLVASGQFRAAFPLHVFPISEVEQAFRFIQGGKSSGKIVVETRKDAKVQVSQSSVEPESFRINNATDCSANETRLLI